MSSATAIDRALQSAMRQHKAGRLDEADALCRKILELEPQHARATHLLGVVSFAAGRVVESLDLIREAISIQSDVAEFHGSLGLILSGLGQVQDAIAEYEHAIQLEPDYVEAYYNLGIAYRLNNQHEQAIECYHKALKLKPKFAQALNNLGHVQRKTGRLDEAIETFNQVLSIQPNHLEAMNNLGVTFKDIGRLDEAITYLDHARKLRPKHAAIHSNRLYSMHFHPAFDAATIYAEHEKWNRQHALPLFENIPHENDRSPDRRLRIGYVSPDFRDHCQAMFTVPLLSNHDHEALEIFCYSDVAVDDAITRELQTYADTWRKTLRLDETKLAQQIRDDQIDILVDLTLHMGSNRMKVFAHKPAPVQATWLGYPSTTGLTAIDYRLTDPYLDPPGLNDEFYAEKSLRLAHSFWCYRPLHEEPAVNELPALKNGHITFGCLNNFCKINDIVLKMWAEVMRAVPDSKLILLAPQGSAREELLRRMDIESSRIQFVSFCPRQQYLELYHRIDLCLDTFPYNGHTTSFDSWWMGVPVVSLCGQTAVSRAGLSQATNLNLVELVAFNQPDFVRIAVELAGDVPRLQQLRRSLRERIRFSPIMNAPKFARDMESAFRTIWRTNCRGDDIISQQDVSISLT